DGSEPCPTEGQGGGAKPRLGEEKEGTSAIPGFNQIQFEGFYRFIDQGLIEELAKFPKIAEIGPETVSPLFREAYH
ncbi:hypothetical protein J0688_25395, partial [Vibrio parahaemolyticus]|nr:hypothetical protein [Vibrio parahaemolyticus]